MNDPQSVFAEPPPALHDQNHCFFVHLAYKCTVMCLSPSPPPFLRARSMSRTVAIAFACLLSTTAHAACPAATPVDTARWIYEKHQDFYLNGKGSADYLSKPLLSLLKKDWACQNGDQCAVSANPWTDAQDGDVQKPIDWKLVSTSDKQTGSWCPLRTS
ncbi:hypothetical protein ALQ91_05263, partial [Pseudomonas syringae pv. syringae]